MKIILTVLSWMLFALVVTLSMKLIVSPIFFLERKVDERKERKKNTLSEGRVQK